MNIQEIKKDIYELIQLGDLTDNSFKKLFINKHSIIGKECELWDFKENFDGTKEAYLKLLKAIASFYNSYGGYIFYGVKEVIKDTSMKVIGVNQNIMDNQKLRGQFDKFFGRRIDLTYFEIEEYKILIQEHCRNLHLQPFNDKNAYKLQEVSEGSPLFTESILRLCKLGLSLDDAINEWKGKSGDAVRVAALRKEVKELSQEAIKILITISVVGTCSRTELRQYTDLENHDLERAMEDLGNLFLIKSIGFIESEPRFETSSSISKLVISISDEILPNAEAFITQVNEISVGLSDNAKLKSNNSEVGKVIRQCNSLIKEHRFDEARKIIKDMLKKPRFKENSDIYFMAAKIQYEDNEAKPESVRKSFVDAYVKGQKKPFFFEMWYQTEMKFGTANSIHDVCTNALKNISSNDYQWCERYVYACHELARNAKSDTIELKYLVMGYEYVNSLIKNSKPPKKTEFIHLSRTLVDKIWELSIAIGKHEISVVIIMNAINFGDIRSATFNKLLNSANMILSKTFLNTEVAKHKNDLINSIQKAVRFLRECNPPRPELAEKLNIALGLLIESVTE
ncbi:ATP-binding protein [Dickeya oryzae]|uniref:ATP-binding protein n=1 Tax=Dickeya oryzae TaxID=1240404 RepID=UPI003160BE83